MITLKEGTLITKDVLSKILAQRKDYSINEKYYLGLQPILDRYISDSTKPNNKIVCANAAYITDINVGYFMGQPVSYTSSEEAYLEKMQEIFDCNDEQDINAMLAKDCSIYGRAYELMYIDEDTKVRFNRIHPANMILVYNTKIIPEPWLALRLYTSGDEDVYLEVYEKTVVKTYKTNKSFSALVLENEAANEFGEIPVNEYTNNDECQGDFDKVKSLIDAYDKAQSDTANDFEYFTDAYLHLHNINLDDDEIQKLKMNRVLKTEGDAAGIVEWIVKEVQDAATENFKNRIAKDIAKFSKTPNMTDEEFSGNLSGVALSYKLLGLEWNASNKERKFKKGLQRRIELITIYLSILNEKYDYNDIKIEFNRDLPQNVAEIVEMLTNVRGTISEQTYLTLLPFIDDVAEEQQRMDDEAADMASRQNPRGTVDLDNPPETMVTEDA